MGAGGRSSAVLPHQDVGKCFIFKLLTGRTVHQNVAGRLSSRCAWRNLNYAMFSLGLRGLSV